VTDTVGTFSSFTLIAVALYFPPPCFVAALTIYVSVTCWKPVSHAPHCSHSSLESSLTSSVLLITHVNKIFRHPYFFIRKTLWFMFFCMCMQVLPQFNQHFCIHTKPWPWYAIQSIKNCNLFPSPLPPPSRIFFYCFLYWQEFWGQPVAFFMGGSHSVAAHQLPQTSWKFSNCSLSTIYLFDCKSG